jgi:hypothetical protein
MEVPMTQYREVREELFCRLIEKQKNEYTGTLEPFEAYANRLKAQWHDTYDRYIECLQRGYEVIIDEISSQIETDSSKDGGIK